MIRPTGDLEFIDQKTLERIVRLESAMRIIFQLCRKCGKDQMLRASALAEIERQAVEAMKPK